MKKSSATTTNTEGNIHLSSFNTKASSRTIQSLRTRGIMSSGNKELFEKGLQNRREVVGEAYVERALNNGSSDFAFANQQLVTEYVAIFPLIRFRQK